MNACFSRHQASAQSLLMATINNYTSAESSASVGLEWLFELVCDDPGNYSADDVSTTFSLLFRRRRPRKRVGKYWRWHLDTKMMK